MVMDKHLKLGWAMTWNSKKLRKKTNTKAMDTDVAGSSALFRRARTKIMVDIDLL